MFHVAAAALGISALLVSSARAFHTVQILGAMYLVFLGVRTLLRRDETQAAVVDPTHRLGRIFGQGVIVNILNPKTALFFLAFLPQFVDPSRGRIPPQILFLGTLFALMGLCSDSSWALLASKGDCEAEKQFALAARAEEYFGRYVDCAGVGSRFFGLENEIKSGYGRPLLLRHGFRLLLFQK